MDANDRRNEWLVRQSAADYAITITPSPFPSDEAIVAALKKHKRAAALAAAQAAVVKAAMNWHEAPMRPRVVTEEALDAACADLKKLGG